jgi:endonuclease III
MSTVTTVPTTDVVHVCRALARNYPDSTLGNKRNPLDEYLFILLSFRTNTAGCVSAYRGFKRRFPRWGLAARATETEIAATISCAGLATQKAKHISSAIRFIKKELGEISLRKLRKWPEDEVETFLRSIPGVGIKIAKCIMMYSLEFDVLPVDTHVERIAKRLGWVTRSTSAKLHNELAGLVPTNRMFSFHVACVQHGRQVCRGPRPRCEVCCLDDVCRKCGVNPSAI